LAERGSPGWQVESSAFEAGWVNEVERLAWFE
jgi:hypothetical protein